MIFAAISDTRPYPCWLVHHSQWPRPTVTHLIPNKEDDTNNKDYYNRTNETRRDDVWRLILAQKNGRSFRSFPLELLSVSCPKKNESVQLGSDSRRVLQTNGGIHQQSDLCTNVVDVACPKDYFHSPPYRDDEWGKNNNEELEQFSVQYYSDWLISTWMELMVVEYTGPPLAVVVEEEW